MKYYIIAGEASGDLHASNLMKGLKPLDGNAEFRAWGGDLMEDEGAFIVKHYRDLAFMGFVEVLANIRTIFRNLDLCKKDILDYKPDVIILVDYPGFNMRIGQWAKEAGFKVFYYISPQVWAWKQGRVKKLRKFVDRMFVILPFEKDFYARHSMSVEFVGHPLLDAIHSFRKNPEKLGIPDDGRKIIALLPGSRKQELKRMLPVMAEVPARFKDYRFIIAAAPGLSDEIYQSYLDGTGIELVRGKTYALLNEAHAALVTSGTATLEAALFRVPEVVLYKGNALSYFIGKKLVKVNFISLANLIMDREVARELIQHEMNIDQVCNELEVLLEGERREKQLQDFDALIEMLGGHGASDLAAKKMYDRLIKQ